MDVVLDPFCGSWLDVGDHRGCTAATSSRRRSRQPADIGRATRIILGRHPAEPAQPNHSAEQERISYLEKKILTKDEVLAELMAEHVAL